MKRMIKFGSINDYRVLIEDIKHITQYVKQDDSDNSIYDETINLPKLSVVGSEKIHGTNGSVCYSNLDGFWIQSKDRILSLEDDNAECCKENLKKKDSWIKIIKSLANEYDIDLNQNIITVFFEWSGGNIMGSKSALYKLDYKSMIFQYFMVTPTIQKLGKDNRETGTKWFQTCTNPGNSFDGNLNNIWVADLEDNIFNVMNYDTYHIEIDFNKPKESKLKLENLVKKIEQCSPIAKSMGQSTNIGEGIVIQFKYNDKLYRAKFKGEKHAGKTRMPKILDPEALAKEKIVNQFVLKHGCTNIRLNQAYIMSMDILNGGKGDIRKTDVFMKWLVTDIIKEKSNILKELTLDKKDVTKKISQIGREWLINRLDEEAGL